MTGPARSALRRDLELIDAALLQTVQRLLAGEVVATDPADDVLCRLVAERVAVTAETLSGLASRQPEPYRALEAA